MTVDLRRVRVGIEILDHVQWYEGMRIKATGTKYANPLQNEATITISGLSMDTRDYLITETSQFNKNKTVKRVFLEVGRISTGLFKLYEGDITSAEPSSPPDVDLVLKAKTKNTSSGNVISVSGQPVEKLSSIAQQVATAIGAVLEFHAADKNIANYAYSGGALGQVGKLQQAGGVRAFVDDNRLIVRDFDKPVPGRHRILNINSGLVGIPKPTEKGVDVTFLIDGEAIIGGSLTIDSKINKATNGNYSIDQLKFDVASHDDPFFYQAICSRL